MEKQIDLENYYYSHLNAFYSTLISSLLVYLDKKKFPPSIQEIYQISNNFFKDYKKVFDDVNHTVAYRIVKLSSQVYNDDNNEMYINALYPRMVTSYFNDLTLYNDNLFGSIRSRFVNIVPFGLTLANFGYAIYTEDNTREALIRRSNYSIHRYVRDTVGQGTVNSLLHMAKLDGYTEYLADNQQDDKVRETHLKYFNGHDWISIDNPPAETGHVATEDNCRCYIIAFR